MKCERCKQYEETGMTTGGAWNHCKITGAEYFMTGFECDYVDENGEYNGNYEREMQLYQEMCEKYDMNGDPIKDFEGNPWQRPGTRR